MQFPGHFLVQGNHSFLDVYDQNNDRSGFDGQINLFQRRLDDDVPGFLAAQQAYATGINQRKWFAAPFHLRCNAVAGDTRLIVYNGNAFAGDTVEERGLAYIWTSDDSDEIGHT